MIDGHLYEIVRGMKIYSIILKLARLITLSISRVSGDDIVSYSSNIYPMRKDV